MDQKKILMTIKIFPEGDQVSLDDLLISIRDAFPDERISNVRREAVGYGIEALVLDITAPERDGISQSYEDRIKSINGVGEIVIESERRFVDVRKPK